MTPSATTLPSSPNTPIVLVLPSPCSRERERERERYVSVSGGPAEGAASKGLNQVSIDTMAKPSRTTALKSSEFHTYGERCPLCVDTHRQTTKTTAATAAAASDFGGLLASAKCLITFKFPFEKKKTVRN